MISAENFTLRPATAEDLPFLYRLFASTHEEELQLFNWGAAQAEAFLRMQLRAQQMGYAAAHPQAEDEIVMLGDQPVGRRLVERGEREIALIDIALLIEHRGQGIGTSLIRDLLAEAHATSKPIRLQVRLANTGARKLYDQLGFVPVREDQMYCEMVSLENHS